MSRKKNMVISLILNRKLHMKIGLPIFWGRGGVLTPKILKPKIVLNKGEITQ